MAQAAQDAPATTANGNGADGPASSFPVDSFRDAATHLRRPFDLHAVQFRALDGSKGEKLNCAAYVTARTVIDRLNLVCPHLWEEPRYELVPGGLRCDLTVDGLTRSDVGWSGGTGNAMQLKALYSDAFKRAAVKFGVGVSLYALPRLVLLVEAGDAWAKARQGQNDRWGNQLYSYGVTGKGMNSLRARYELWLSTQESFGDPLGHGHVEGSEDPEDETHATGESDAPAMATEGDVKLLKEAAKGLVFAQVKMCFAAAGLPVPEKARDTWNGVGRDAVHLLAKELKSAPRKPKAGPSS
jgi:hypothetical protein